MRSIRQWLIRRRKKTPEQKQRMMGALKIARLKLVEQIYQNIPPHLRDSSDLAPAIAEQINYATASSQYEGDDEGMRRKLEAVLVDLRANGAYQAADRLVAAINMRGEYLGLTEDIMH